MDLSIEGKILRNGAFETACLGITDGKITALKKTLTAETHRDFGTRLLLPGGIDLHVHFRDPGFPKKEDFQTGSTAAAFGGITTIFDMPNTRPFTSTLPALRDKRRMAQAKSLVDFGLYAAITEDNLGQLPALARECSGFKIFLGSSTNAGSLPTTSLQDVLQTVKPTVARTLIHAEDDRCLLHHAGPEENLPDHNRRRPADCEEEAINHILDADVKTPLHICHLSSREGLHALSLHPPCISIGVTPHHLLLDATVDGEHPTWYKVNPPLRAPADREALWNAVVEGRIDIFESDHAPHTLEEKEAEFAVAPSGLPGVETMYPLFLALVSQQRLDLSRVQAMLCERPAALAGLPKGRLEVGRDADIVVVDLKDIRKVRSDRLHSRCGWTAFEGWPAVFPVAVFLRGEQLVDGTELVNSPGCGHCVDGKGPEAGGEENG